jgi:hypothetical protein
MGDRCTSERHTGYYHKDAANTSPADDSASDHSLPKVEADQDELLAALMRYNR